MKLLLSVLFTLLLTADDENVKQENMQFFAPKVAGANNQVQSVSFCSESKFLSISVH